MSKKQQSRSMEIARSIEASYVACAALVRTQGERAPTRIEVAKLVECFRDICFPGIASKPVSFEVLRRTLPRKLRALDVQLQRLLACEMSRADAKRYSGSTLAAIPKLRCTLNLDATALAQNDPAAQSVLEVVLAYPGFSAIFVHRIAHELWNSGAKLLARLLSEFIHGQTGIDIHPAATIGESFYLDHGTGVVIGETCVIGKHVRIFQGTTLGAISVSGRAKGAKRHPTIEDNVTIYANATILGGETVVGAGSIVGGNVWLVESVPPGSRVHSQSSSDHATQPSGSRKPGARTPMRRAK